MNMKRPSCAPKRLVAKKKAKAKAKAKVPAPVGASLAGEGAKLAKASKHDKEWF